MASKIDFSRPLLCLACDKDSLEANLRLAVQVAGEVDMIKVNDDAVDDAGLGPLVKPFLEFGLPLFVDEKNLKGARTMARRAVKAADLGVAFINAYALADYLLRGPVEALKGSDTRLLVLTVPTHFDDAYCLKYYRRPLAESVRMFSETAIEFGGDGILLPPTTLSAVSDLVIEIRATPGISLPDGKPRDEQRSFSTPEGAVLGGSNILIVGSAIANYPEGPAAGARRIKEEMLEAFKRRRARSPHWSAP